MLLPAMYKVDDRLEIEAFLRRYSFATVVAQNENDLKGMAAAHVPLLIKFDGTTGNLRGHLTASNPVIQGLRKHQNLLAIFHGPHGYISSSWYVDQTIPPTWNFTAVHIQGPVRVLDSPSDKMEILKETVATYERKNGTNWTFSERDPNIHQLLPLITGFEVEFDIKSIQCCYKLSQNRDDNDFNSAVKNLEARGDHESVELAQWMKTKVRRD